MSSDPLQGLRVALVHDWLTGLRGGERVLDCLAQVFPQAHLFTLLKTAELTPAIEALDLTCSPAQRLPGLKRYYRHYLPLYPWAVGRLDLRGYDLVISTSHCVAKGAKAAPGALHLSYVFTPMRYIWDMFPLYFGRRGPLVRTAMGALAPFLRSWDVRTCKRADVISCISHHVARRIKKHWGIEARVIHPPVELDRFSLGPSGDYYLMVSALAPYKGVELAVRAANMAGFKLKIAGDGQERQRLESLSGPTVEFLGRVEDGEVARLYAGCRAFIFPGEEDFGITPLEALASGKPVLALGRGGIWETVTPLNPQSPPPEAVAEPDRAPGGVFFYQEEPRELVRALEILDKSYHLFEPRQLRRSASAFDRPVFKKHFRSFAAASWLAHQNIS